MDIFYEIHSLRNQRGEGKEKEYVVLRNGRPMSDEEMESSIEASCTLTKADVRGLWAAFRELALEELSKGHRVRVAVAFGWPRQAGKGERLQNQGKRHPTARHPFPA